MERHLRRFMGLVPRSKVYKQEDHSILARIGLLPALQEQLDQFNNERNYARQETLSQLTDPSIVKILAGPDPAKMKKRDLLFSTYPLKQQWIFPMHKELLCNHSPYFAAALNGGFREAATNTIAMDDEDPKVLARFQAWLYTGSFNWELSTTTDWKWGFDLYVFAEKRIIPDLQNAVSDDLIRAGWLSFDSDFTGSAVSRFWSAISDASLMRKLLIDCFLVEGYLRDSLSDERVNTYSPEFLAAIAIRANKLMQDPHSDGFDDDLTKEHCQRYHVHEASDRSCAKLSDLGMEWNYINSPG